MRSMPSVIVAAGAFIAALSAGARASAAACASASCVQDVVFSQTRGLYSSALSLQLSTPTSGAAIRYTTNGSRPTETVGTVYTGAIPITATTVVRAIAYATGKTSSSVSTHTYIVPNKVLQQPVSISGFPRPFMRIGDKDRIGGAEMMQLDYEMDPKIVANAKWSGSMEQSLRMIPSVSVTSDMSSIFSVYQELDMTRPASAEYIDPANPSDNWQSDVDIQSHSHQILKRSIRIEFKAIYGTGKITSNIFRRGLLNGNNAVTEIDRIVLRAQTNRSLIGAWNPDDTVYSRDQWARDTQIAATGVGSHGTFVHLYLNGAYFGLYNAVERLDQRWLARTYGGDDDDYFAVSHSGAKGGSSARWDYIRGALRQKDMAQLTNYRELKNYLDVAEFADYILLNWFSGTADWPRNNWWGGNRNTPTPSLFRFYSWDAEDIFDARSSTGPGDPPQGGILPGRGSDGAWVEPQFRRGATYSTASDILNIWHSIRKSPEFMQLFADRIYKHCFNGGAITDANSRARWKAITDHIRLPMYSEYARWGDARLPLNAIQPPMPMPEILRTPDAYNPEVARVDTRMTGNVSRFITALRAEQYYPTINPPALSQFGGMIDSGFSLSITNPNGSGTIYFTRDGSDPRAEGGGVSASAQTWSGALTLNQSTVVRARVKNGSEWSALADAEFYVRSDLSKLEISEIMYHPNGDAVSGDDAFEFVELRNTGTGTLDLSGVQFTNGIAWRFPVGSSLSPNAYLVLARNSSELKRIRPGLTVFGQHLGELSNLGETLELRGPSGQVLATITYDDRAPWAASADDSGYSLVPKVARTNIVVSGNASDWIASANIGGSPGARDPATVVLGGSPDAGFPDAVVPVDVGFVDSGLADSGVIDSGKSDTGVKPDAMVPVDVGFVDSGLADVGVADAGQSDSGALPDADPAPDADPSPDAGTGLDFGPYEWIAFNDLSWSIDQRSTGITRYTTPAGGGSLPEGSVGLLFDAKNERPTQVRVSIGGGSWDGVAQTTQGQPPVQGTDGDNVFAGLVDLVGVVSYGDAPLELAFEGLEPGRRYSAVLFGNRGVSTYGDRKTRVSLVGADAFENASTVGSTFEGPNDDSVIVVNGDNTATGHVARFVHIRPGDDGVIRIVVDDGGSTAAPKFYLNAFMIALEPDEISPDAGASRLPDASSLPNVDTGPSDPPDNDGADPLLGMGCTCSSVEQAPHPRPVLLLLVVLALTGVRWLRRASARSRGPG